ncbi:hypothetical protein [Albimonas pacifica]|uniref:Uncharacterized protein n=1 Tax=Albimonas pacifica TaxID=1114924 RepID=A0A1I3LH15_9RHOB|nr:hypothetical protein [Albimonas pacifica]SFI84029.1 hypothetical protein SAMN05216258_11025 [Albimonas pacifica]
MPIITCAGGTFNLRNLSAGWIDYADGTYTSGSPLALSGNTDTLLPNDGATVRGIGRPLDVFYDGTDQYIRSTNLDKQPDVHILPISG